MMLAFPSGRLQTATERAIVAAGYLMTTVLHVAPILFTADNRPHCDNCAGNLALVDSKPGLADGLFTVQLLAFVGVVSLAGGVLVRRWGTASAPQRRALAPVLGAGGATGALVVLSAAAESVDLYGLSDAVDWAYLAAFASVPFAFLTGLLRSRLRRADSVSEFVARLGEASRPGELRGALADALGDPSLALAYWLPEQERYVDASGRAVELPAKGSGQVATEIEHEGRRVATIFHDAALCEEPELVRAAGAAAALSLENERLDAELRARLEELRASRERLVEAGDAERRRIERDLHDGTQQRLVSLLLNLKLARRGLDPGLVGPLLDGVETELGQALSELRALASGILPPVLTDHGLEAAVEELVGRSPVRAEISEMPLERLPGTVEVAAYFLIAEALTNVAKHAEATQAKVRVARDDGRAVIEVRDDGVGGVEPERGSGLRGLTDRIDALGGRLRLASPQGEGTTVRAEIPCGS
jgi:signal transduction histidine kinase